MRGAKTGLASDLPDSPLLVFINSRSGGRAGSRLVEVLYHAIGHSQVIHNRDQRGNLESNQIFPRCGIRACICRHMVASWCHRSPFSSCQKLRKRVEDRRHTAGGALPLVTIHLLPAALGIRPAGPPAGPIPQRIWHTLDAADSVSRQLFWLKAPCP